MSTISEPPTEEHAAAWGDEDDWTDEALRLLHDLRSRHRRKRAGQIGYALYCVLLVVVVWGVLPSAGLFLRTSLGADYTAHGPAILAAAPSGIAAISLGLLLLGARDGLWRGPVVPPRESVDWMLAQPVRIARLLRPWFWLSCAVSLAAGVLAAAIGMVTLGLTVKVGLFAAFGWCLVGGASVPLLTTALGVAVEGSARTARWVRALTPYTFVAVLALAGQCAYAADGHRVPVLERIELWSGPWGWAGIAALSPTPASVAGGPIAAALLVALTGCCVAWANRGSGALALATVRHRSRTASGVLNALLTVELRAARQIATGAVGGGRPTRVRLPAPRHAALAVPWRDTLALLRAPGRVGRSVPLMVLAVLSGVLAVDAHRATGVFATAVALAFGYWSVAQLLEPARLETDDTRRGSWSPYPYAQLMLRHAIVPAVLALVIAGAAAVVVLLLGGGVRALLVPAAVPALVAAGLVSACRGATKQHLLMSPAQTPTGGAGPALFVIWYGAGPLTALAVLSLPFLLALHQSSASGVLNTVVASLLATWALLWWANMRAGKLTG